MKRAEARFVVNYVRVVLDDNDDGERLAYFEVLSGLDLGEVLRLYRKRTHWPDYPEFPDALRCVSEGT
jgi:hypothetical protein